LDGRQDEEDDRDDEEGERDENRNEGQTKGKTRPAFRIRSQDDPLAFPVHVTKVILRFCPARVNSFVAPKITDGSVPLRLSILG
jgi:hypothetical protein